jgi:hypothetical protein
VVVEEGGVAKQTKSVINFLNTPSPNLYLIKYWMDTYFLMGVIINSRNKVSQAVSGVRCK